MEQRRRWAHFVNHHGLSSQAVTMAERFASPDIRRQCPVNGTSAIVSPRPHRQGLSARFTSTKQQPNRRTLARRQVSGIVVRQESVADGKIHARIDRIHSRKQDQALPLLVLLGAALPGGAASDLEENKSDFGVYGDVVEEMTRIGEILDTLMAEGLEKTLAALPDNGPEPLTKESLAKLLRAKNGVYSRAHACRVSSVGRASSRPAVADAITPRWIRCPH